MLSAVQQSLGFLLLFLSDPPLGAATQPRLFIARLASETLHGSLVTQEGIKSYMMGWQMAVCVCVSTVNMIMYNEDYRKA